MEFEGGDPDHPIWTGCFWGLGETPVVPALAETKVFKTDHGRGVVDHPWTMKRQRGYGIHRNPLISLEAEGRD